MVGPGGNLTDVRVKASVIRLLREITCLKSLLVDFVGEETLVTTGVTVAEFWIIDAIRDCN